MAYRFSHEESFEQALHRIGAEQFHRLMTELATSSAPGAIHQTRKCIKRLRAVLRLVRPGIGEHAFKRENARLRDAARLLSKSRDRTVLRQTSTWLAQQQDSPDDAAFARLDKVLAGDALEAAVVDSEDLSEARAVLVKAEHTWAKLRLDPDSFAPMASGLATTYQSCSDDLALAYGSHHHGHARDHAP